MRIVYPGPFAQVEIPALGLIVDRDIPVDVPEPYAMSLAAQGWKPVRQPKPGKQE